MGLMAGRSIEMNYFIMNLWWFVMFIEMTMVARVRDSRGEESGVIMKG